MYECENSLRSYDHSLVLNMQIFSWNIKWNGTLFGNYYVSSIYGDGSGLAEQLFGGLDTHKYSNDVASLCHNDQNCENRHISVITGTSSLGIE